MTTENILSELIQERDRINSAIQALRGGGSGVGNGKVGRPRGLRGPMSEETKQKMRDAWARRRKMLAKAAKS